MTNYLLLSTPETVLDLLLSLTHLVLAVDGSKLFLKSPLLWPLFLHGPEFVVGLRLWLGIPLFPLSPLCVCLTSIDQFGDHLLECSHGPMRIRRHDALVDIVVMLCPRVTQEF